MFGFIFSVVSYLGFLAVFTYFAWFSDGVFVPKHVDNGMLGSPGLAVVINMGLVLLFGLQHSIMARDGFKRWFTRVVPPPLERACYVLASSLALGVLIWLWRPLPAVLWNVASPGPAAALWAVNAVGWLGVPVASLMIDHLDLFGVKQAFHAFRRATFERRGFVTPMLYKYVRHPMMSALLLALWVTPHMTVGHLLLSLGMTCYVLIGVHFEERSLTRDLGRKYARYQAVTPKFLPVRGRRPLEDIEVTSVSRSETR
jgi:protein-S-isoprenylcysteine O-methyltransferase Ste14